MEDCLFCKIINGQVPATKVYENDKVVAFLDISPVNQGHTLVVPKEHSENLLDISDDVLCEVSIATKKVGQAIVSGLGVGGFNLIQNNGSVAGQVISHFHWHLIPRHSDDGLALWSQGKYKEGEEDEVAEKIKSKL
ncbi:MAG: HIT family protein [Parcubacteria group bacterium]|nr:HIT family protein [Parcubacteria group bacterium]